MSSIIVDGRTSSGTTTTSIFPDAFVERIETYIGVPWVHQGRSRDGVDCIGLPICAARDLGATIRDNLNYSRHPDPAVLKAGLLDHGHEIPVRQTEVGDLIVLRARLGGPAVHIYVRGHDDVVTHADGNVTKRVCQKRLTTADLRLASYGVRFDLWRN